MTSATTNPASIASHGTVDQPFEAKLDTDHHHLGTTVDAAPTVDTAPTVQTTTGEPGEEIPSNSNEESGSAAKRFAKAAGWFLVMVLIGACLKGMTRRAVRASFKPPTSLVAAAEARSERMERTQEAVSLLMEFSENDSLGMEDLQNVLANVDFAEIDPLYADYLRRLTAFAREVVDGVARQEAAVAKLDREVEQFGEAGGFLTYLASDDKTAERNRRGGQVIGGLLAVAGQTGARKRLDENYALWAAEMEKKGEELDAFEVSVLEKLNEKYHGRFLN